MHDLDARRVRRIWPHEFPLLEAHLLRLPAEDLRLRFGGGVSPVAVSRYVRGLKTGRQIILGMFVAGVLRGSGVLARSEARAPGEGELAFSVEPAWRNAGVATELMRRLVLIARNRAIGKLDMQCLPENLPMRRVARKAGMRLESICGEVVAHLDPPWPTPLSLAREAVEEAGAALLEIVDRIPRPPELRAGAKADLVQPG